MSFAALIAPQATFYSILYDGVFRVEGRLKYKGQLAQPTFFTPN